MAADTDFNYADILSLEKAKLANRIRLNFLGSQELVLDYTSIAGGIREDCVEYLEDNRLSVTNPKFGFKTYEGIWTCIDITYNEDKKTIRQRFKIDSSLGEVDVDGLFDGGGDVSRISAGGTVERAYYWRIADPSSIELPASVPNGQIYTKTATDNGDGTYDVTITKETAINLSSSSAVMAGPEDGSDIPGGYEEDVDISTSSTELDFVKNGGSVADAVVGEIKRIDNVPLDDGSFRTSVTTRTAIAQRVPPESEAGGPNYPWFEYGSDYVQDANNIIVGRNQTWDKVVADRDRSNISPALFKINSMSVRVNDFGLFDYTITSNSPG